MCEDAEDDEDAIRCDSCNTKVDCAGDLDDDLLCEDCAREADEDAAELRSLRSWYQAVAGP